MLLRVKMWGIESEECHRDDLAPGDLALIYVAGAHGGFIGRAELATPVHEWEPSEAQAYPGDSTSGVAFSDVERWDRAVPMAIVRRTCRSHRVEPGRASKRSGGLPDGRGSDDRRRVRGRGSREPRLSEAIAESQCQENQITLSDTRRQGKKGSEPARSVGTGGRQNRQLEPVRTLEEFALSRVKRHALDFHNNRLDLSGSGGDSALECHGRGRHPDACSRHSWS